MLDPAVIYEEVRKKADIEFRGSVWQLILKSKAIRIISKARNTASGGDFNKVITTPPISQMKVTTDGKPDVRLFLMFNLCVSLASNPIGELSRMVCKL